MGEQFPVQPPDIVAGDIFSYFEELVRTYPFPINYGCFTSRNLVVQSGNVVQNVWKNGDFLRPRQGYFPEGETKDIFHRENPGRTGVFSPARRLNIQKNDVLPLSELFPPVEDPPVLGDYAIYEDYSNARNYSSGNKDFQTGRNPASGIDVIREEFESR